MLFTLTYEPGSNPSPEPGTRSGEGAEALGYLLHKHPERVGRFSSSVGEIHVFFPEATPERCTAAMLLEVDPVGIVRNKRFRGDAGSLEHYVNDRPYAASSMLSVAIGTVFRTAMNGRSDAYPELARTPLPLRIDLPVVSSRGGEADLIRRLFEPCGWTVSEQRIPLDPEYPAWGDSHYSAVALTGRVLLSHALRQLYVLLPVLDDAKHYWLGDDEIAKLERNGEGWLAEHPERDLITRRYLGHHRSLLAPRDAAKDPAEDRTGSAPQHEPLRQLRADAVLRALHGIGAHRVIDMGCGSGALLRRLVADRDFTSIVGVDVSTRALEQARAALRLDEASDTERDRIQLLHGSVVYRDPRLEGYDAIVLMEVVEHVDPERLGALEDAIFAGAAPGAVIVTTPNAEYNARYEGLAPGEFRHDDHRFEWTRAQFGDWASGVSEQRGYTVELGPVGDIDPELGSPTQMAIFRKQVTA